MFRTGAEALFSTIHDAAAALAVTAVALLALAASPVTVSRGPAVMLALPASGGTRVVAFYALLCANPGGDESTPRTARFGYQELRRDSGGWHARAGESLSVALPGTFARLGPVPALECASARCWLR
jgi:hypothetical protein